MQKLLASHNAQISRTGYVFVAVKTESHSFSQKENDPLCSQGILDNLPDEQALDGELQQTQLCSQPSTSKWFSPETAGRGSMEDDLLIGTNNSINAIFDSPGMYQKLANVLHHIEKSIFCLGKGLFTGRGSPKRYGSYKTRILLVQKMLQGGGFQNLPILALLI